VRVAESLIGLKAETIPLHDGSLIPGAVIFRVQNDSAIDSVLKLHHQLESLGAYLRVVEHGSPAAEFHSNPGEAAHDTTIPAEPDLIGLLPTVDKFEAVRLIGTNGNGKYGNDEVVAWLRNLDRTQPLVVVGAGYDFVEGAFVDPIRDPQALARAINTFCPDSWAAGPAFLEKGPPEPHIAKHLSADRTFDCWWD
jgi:hypothetical protein